MPQKLCFIAMLISPLLFAEAVAQQPASSSRTGRLSDSSRSAPFEVSTVSPTPLADESGRQADHLGQPALHLTPDRYVRPVQQAGYTTVSDSSETISADNRPSVPKAEMAQTLPGEVTTQATPDRNAGFPSLSPRGESQSARVRTPGARSGAGSVVTVISSLAIVLGLFFVTAWFMRRTGPGAITSLPSDVFEVLGRAPLNHRQQVHLVRCGSKLLLVSLTPDTAETLTEIDDPDEVTRLSGICRTNHSGSTSAAFRQVLHQFAGQPAEPGYFGHTDSRTNRAPSPQNTEDLHG